MNSLITIVLMNRELHLSQPITGLIQYAKEIHARCVIEEFFEMHIKAAALKVYVDHQILVFDMDDGYNNVEDYRYLIMDCDYYFKRSFNRMLNTKYFSKEQNKKIFPYGLNYYISCPSNPFNYAIYPFPINIKRFIKYIILNNASFTEEVFLPNNIECDSIIFCTRLYEPNTRNKSFNDDCVQINNQRIKLIRALRKFPNFIGGIEDSKYSRRIAPDCIIDKKHTKKENYIEELRKAKICIASRGLHGSTGWKFAEYLSMNKIIVSDELKYELPGNFQSGPGKNYFSFSSIQQCIEICNSILKPDQAMLDSLETMKKNNAEYYAKYLKPIQIIKNCLDIASVK